MAVLQMQKLCICALKTDQEELLDRLQAAGVLEISSEPVPENGLRKTDTMAYRQELERRTGVLEQALEVLTACVPEKNSLFASLEGRTLTESSVFLNFAEQAEDILAEARQILELNKQTAEIKAAIAKLEAQKEALAPWKDLGIPFQCQTTEKTQILIGTAPAQMTLETLYQTAAERVPELVGVDLELVGADRDQIYLSAVCLKKDAGHLEEALRSVGFARPAQSFSETPSEYRELCRQQMEAKQTELLALKEKLTACAGSRERLKAAADYYRLCAQKQEVIGDLLQSEKTFLITGFIPERAAEKLKAELNGHYTLSVETEPVPEEEEAPVLLSNSSFASCAEGITASFGLPAKKEMDPTGIMAICYVFLFGLMLSDAAYGLIVFAACFILLKKFPRMSDGMNKSLQLFMYCGLSTLFWGVMFGGYFGDAVDIISRVYLGKEISVPALWFVPLNNPMKLLLFSMLFGVIHLYLGLALKGCLLLRDGKWKDFIYDVVFWYVMLTGLVLMLIPTDLFAPIIQMTVVFPPFVNALAKWMAILGAVGILLMSARENKNPVLRLALGAYDLYNLTGWLSDVLSYSRLLALGLATGVIASVINQMGSMMGSGIFGTAVFVVVFIVGHILNLAINLLGAYVHTCRLQYVEFFGKFYEGGGRAFQPFRQNTKYIEIKED